jgi:hypothetical protein
LRMICGVRASNKEGFGISSSFCESLSSIGMCCPSKSRPEESNGSSLSRLQSIWDGSREAEGRRVIRAKYRRTRR